MRYVVAIQSAAVKCADGTSQMIHRGSTYQSTEPVVVAQAGLFISSPASEHDIAVEAAAIGSV